MGALFGFGYIFFVYGPPLILYAKFISKTPETNLVAISSALVWVFSIMPPSIVEVINGGVLENTEFIPLYIALAVFFQEAARYLYVKYYFAAEARVMDRANLGKSLFKDLPIALSAGFGFGTMNALVYHSGALSGTFAERINGDFYDKDTCDGVSVFVISAVNALFFQFIHMAISIHFFLSFRKKQLNLINHNQVIKTCLWYSGIHLFAALITSLNLLRKGCDAAIPLLFLTTVILCYKTKKTIQKPEYVMEGIAEQKY